jgi:glycolate oxidase FAD binding subunit
VLVLARTAWAALHGVPPEPLTMGVIGVGQVGRRVVKKAHILGMRVLHADGTGSKTGGKVVKNVTGYDLAKLYTGSLGALVWIAEVNLRLVPTPASSALVVASVAREQAEARLLALHRSPLQPTASLALAGDACEAIPVPSGEIVLVARFEGNEAAVRYQVEEALRLWGGETWQAERAAPVVEALQANLDARPGAVSLRIASMPVMGLRALECFEGSTPWETGGGLVAQFGAGIAVAHLPGNTNSSELGALVARLHSQGSAVTLLGTPGNRAIRLAAGSNGLDEVALDLVQRTKRAFDPIGILPPYNGVGGWR